MRKNNTIISPLSEGEGLVVRRYTAPSIEVISQVYDEGLMTTLSTGDGGEGTGLAKPGGGWNDDAWGGEVWSEPADKGDDDNWM